MNASLGKRLLLVNMEYSQEELNEPINMDILIGCIPQDMYHEVDVRAVYRDMDYADNVLYDCYDVVLVSSKISSFESLSGILSQCETNLTLVGGILPIIAAEDLASIFPSVVFVTGEAEVNLETALRLAAKANDNDEFKRLLIEHAVPNVCFMQDGKPEPYSSERTVCDLLHLQPPFHHRVTDVIARNGLVRMETSRGCPWNQCSFCVLPWRYCNSTWRAYSKQKVEGEIRQLVMLGANRILFTDEDFVGNEGHILSLCDSIARVTEPLGGALFGGSTSVFTLLGLGEQMDSCLARMREVGFELIFLGIESGCNQQLKRFRKGVTAEMNERMILKLRELGFSLDIGFIMFDADTTLDELEETVAFLDRTGLSDSFSRLGKRLRLTPHTALCEDYMRRGLVSSNLDLNELYFDYAFVDSSIGVLYEYLRELEENSLEEAYRLQAELRAGTSKNEHDAIRRKLGCLRRNSYQFLCDCISLYRQNGFFDEDCAATLYAKHISHWRRNDIHQ